MAEKFLRNGVVLAKLEAVYGTDPVPTATDIILCSIPTHNVAGDRRDRTYMRNTLSPLGFTIGVTRQTISFACELKGPNSTVAPKTPTYLEPLLVACGLAATDGTISADDCRVYTPLSAAASMKSCTIYYFLDGIKHAMTGCRGNAVFEWPVDGHPSVTFTMTGFYVAPSDVAAPGPITYPTYQPPVCNGIAFALGAYTPIGVEKITLDMGNQIVEKKDLNNATGLSSILITGRQPKMSASFDVEALATFNPYTLYTAGTTQVLTWCAGVKGNRVRVDAPTAQMEDPTKGNKDGRAQWNISMVLTGVDNEFTLKTG